MQTLIIDRRGTKLSYRQGAIRLQIADEKPQHIPIRLLERVILMGNMHMETALLNHLSEQGVSLTVLPGRGHRRSCFLSSQTHGDALRRIGQYQTTSDPTQALFWSQRLIRLRILGARRLLQQTRHNHLGDRLKMTHGLNRLDKALQNLPNARSVDQVRGMEGAAAASYFAAYTSLFSERLDFTGRNRRPPRDPVNATLSLGYTLAHGDALRALTIAGLDPMLGFLHQPEHNRESLACDLVEIARPRIERLVWRLFAEKKLRKESFGRDGSAIRLNKAGRQTFFACHEQHAQLHRRWFRRYAQLLTHHFLLQNSQWST